MKRLLPIVFLIAGIAVFKLLPWWGSLAVLACVGLAVKLLAGRVVKGLFLGAFRAKGAALAGAATLHGITRAEPAKPDSDQADGDAGEPEPHGPLRWVHIDLTVHVPDANGGKTPFRLWDAHELGIVPVDTKPGIPADDEEELGTIAGVEVYEDGRWVTLEGKLEGSHRIRLHAGVRPSVEHFKLRYYFEILENRATVHRG